MVAEELDEDLEEEVHESSDSEVVEPKPKRRPKGNKRRAHSVESPEFGAEDDALRCCISPTKAFVIHSSASTDADASCPFLAFSRDTPQLEAGMNCHAFLQPGSCGLQHNDDKIRLMC